MKITTIEELTTLLKESAIVPDSFNVEATELAVKSIDNIETAIGVYSRLAAQAIFENKESIQFLEERDRNAVEQWLKSGKIEDGKALELVDRAISNQKTHGWQDRSGDDECESVFQEYGSIFEQGKSASVSKAAEGKDTMKEYGSIFEQGQQSNIKTKI